MRSLPDILLAFLSRRKPGDLAPIGLGLAENETLFLFDMTKGGV